MLNLNKPSALKYIGTGWCVLFLGFWIYRSFYYIPHDFANSYFGSFFFLKGEFDAGIFDPYTFNKKIYDEGVRQVFASFNPNPPSVALFFSPFALLSLPWAKLTFNIVSSVLFLISAHRLCKHLKIESGIILLLIPFIFFTPVRNQILFGQTYFLLFFLLTEGYLAYEKKRYLLASVLWSVAIFLKIFPAIIVLFLFARKEWKMSMYLGGSCLVILLSCLFLQGIDIWSFYIKEVLTHSSAGEVNLAYESNFQSAQMLFKFLFVNDPQLNPQTLINSSFMFQLCDLVFKSTVLTVCATLILRSESIVSFAFLFLGSILILSYGSTYGNLLLVILYITMYGKLSLKHFAALSIILLFICNLPISFFSALPALVKFPRLYLLITLFIFVAVLLRIRIEWKFSAVFLILFSIPVLLRPRSSEDQSHLLLDNQKHSLIYNYEINGEMIAYYYWDERGENLFNTAIKASAIPASNVELIDNQIFYQGKQITNSPDNKLKPSLINGTEIIYLSDKNRGIGFYTLRIINLH